MPLTRGKQFVLIQPGTTTRVDLDIELPAASTGDRLQEAGSSGSGSITYKVALTSTDDLGRQVVTWLPDAYEGAG